MEPKNAFQVSNINGLNIFYIGIVIVNIKEMRLNESFPDDF